MSTNAPAWSHTHVLIATLNGLSETKKKRGKEHMTWWRKRFLGGVVIRKKRNWDGSRHISSMYVQILSTMFGK